MAWLTQDFDLEDGKSYWLLGPDPTVTVNGQSYTLTPGVWTPIVWKQPLKLTYGNVVNKIILDWALRVLRDTKLLRALSVLDVREILVLPGFPNPTWWGPPGSSWGGVSASRAVVLPDIAPMPGSYLPATILHEATHGWQVDQGLDKGSSPQLLEITASMVAQVFHFLYDGLQAFGPGSPYAQYKDLFRVDY